ncbi:hypothetical protein L0A91_13805 [Ornithinimicrobium sp. INDO-MA30-4]|nr:hypothetical protein [Ornithinimicrobium sp. INDO-MA30-4]UJH70226.1 hypothetical protein L0A91_13805 [Ornithinimicrobium sp. INDO-MA30-4]
MLQRVHHRSPQRAGLRQAAHHAQVAPHRLRHSAQVSKVPHLDTPRLLTRQDRDSVSKAAHYIDHQHRDALGIDALLQLGIAPRLARRLGTFPAGGPV